MRLAGNKQTSKKHVIWVWYDSKAYHRGKVFVPVYVKIPIAFAIGLSRSVRVMRLDLQQDMASYKFNGVIIQIELIKL